MKNNVKKYDCRLFTMDNLRLAQRVSERIYRQYLVDNKSWNPFMDLNEELSLISCSKARDRYERCTLFIYACAEQAMKGEFPASYKDLFI